MSSIIDEEWAVLAKLLPPGWEEQARTTGALRRARGVAGPEELLRLLLLHVAGGLSLRSAAARGSELGLAEMTDVALLKRLRNAEVWLRTMGAQMFERARFFQGESVFPSGRRWRAVDATTIEEPGATGTDWRVHYSVALPGLECDFFELTDKRGGETFTRFPVQKGDVLLGDRGYAHRRGVAHLLESGADVVVRLTSTTFPLTTLKGGDFALLDWLRKIRGTTASACPVRFTYRAKKTKAKSYDVRLCALRKSKVATEQAQTTLLRTAKKKGRKVRPETLEAAEYVFVLTTLSEADFSASRILSIYRARWQVELVFKRMKTLLRLGHLPKYSASSSRAWIQGKLLTVLLIERLLSDAKFISPWGYELSPA